MNILLYNCNSDNRVVSKNITLMATATFSLKEECSISSPSIILENLGNEVLKNVNYFYIPQWNRYYYVTNINIKRGEIVEISGKVDVLMSNKSAILSSIAFVERNEFIYNDDIPDEHWTVTSKRKYTYHNILDIDVASKGRYYLATV